MIISDRSKVHLKVHSRSHNYLVAIDGNSKALQDTTEVIISKAPLYGEHCSKIQQTLLRCVER